MFLINYLEMSIYLDYIGGGSKFFDILSGWACMICYTVVGIFFVSFI